MYYGADGNTLTNPLFSSGTNKWTIGNNPEDSTQRGTTALPLPIGFSRQERLKLQPTDQKYFYLKIGNNETGSIDVWEFEWVPNGAAVLVIDWGDNGKCVLPVSALGNASNNWFSDVDSDCNYLYVTHCNRTEPIVNFYYIDFDGSIVNEVDITDWWSNPNDLAAGA